MKKKLFTVFMLLGVVATFFIALVMHSWQLMLVGYIFSRIGFSGSCLFYESFLTDVTSDERMDKVSSWGYAMGYIGGSTIPFVISIAVLLLFDYNRFAMTFSVLIVSVWWLLFSIPMLKNVEQKSYKPREPHALRKAFAGIGNTLKSIWADKSLRYFILAYFFYIDGVHTVIKMSTSYGANLGIAGTQLVLALLVTQFVAWPSSIIYGKLGRSVGTKKMLLVGIVAYFLITLFAAFFLRTAMEFWILAVCVGMFQGGIQALSRSEFGKLCPKDHANEYFGFFDIFGKYAAILGTGLVLVFTFLTHNPSLGVLSISLLFVIGFVIMLRVPERR
jgi:UMF1 family MFS transporter